MRNPVALEYDTMKEIADAIRERIARSKKGDNSESELSIISELTSDLEKAYELLYGGL